MGAARLVHAGSLVALATYAGLVGIEARATGEPFAALEPWRLGELADAARPLTLRVAAALLGLALGWAIPGLSLALWLPGRAPSLLGRALGLGTLYVAGVGAAHAALTGTAPGRATLLAALALPSLAALASGVEAASGARLALRGAALAALPLLVAGSALWPRIAHEALNGDGTEAYEHARSLDTHALPRWDQERAEGGGAFGVRAVNPFLTNSYLAHAAMTVAGRAELAPRLMLPPALAACLLLTAALAGGASRSGWTYLVALVALYATWNAFYVGYEPFHSDLAEPAATDTLMLALWLAGFLEVAAGSWRLGAVFLLLAAGVLYSAPLLAGLALVAAWRRGVAGARPALLLLAGTGAALAAAALGYAVAHGLWSDWLRQIHDEYWLDLTDPGRRTPSLPFLARGVLMTGALPLACPGRWRRVSPASGALFLTGVLYAGIVLAGAYKNLHYLAPVPFLLAPAALECTGARARLAAGALLALSALASWPHEPALRTANAELGRLSWVDGMDYESASLAAGVVYSAFAAPPEMRRFAIGKHTWVRYAIGLGGPRGAFRLGDRPRPGWIPIAGDSPAFYARDPEQLARWRFRRLPVLASPLFPLPRSEPLARRAADWRGELSFAEPPGADLVLEHDVAAGRLRLLVPASPARPALLLLPLRGGSAEPEVTLRVNGVPSALAAGASERRTLRLATRGVPWRDGWNVLELRTGAGARVDLAQSRITALGGTVP